ncbi:MULTISPECIES: GNAT family N-acetyltransferase [unclassified Paenibacillus]|uniref:GNAT family N-acetyltransferase n=1 Tax=unclassified Paenibacillus TaxID=185978 RepID=UPI003643A947
MIKLRRFQEDDFDRLINWAKTPEFLLQWAGPMFYYPLDRKQLEKYYHSSIVEKPLRKIYTAINTELNEEVGHIELNNVDLRNNSATISRVLVDERFRGKGYGSQMVSELLEVGFVEMGLHRIDLFVFDFNKSAIACYENAGFVKEGYIRQCRRMGNEYWSLYQMSVLADERKGKAKK